MGHQMGEITSSGGPSRMVSRKPCTAGVKARRRIRSVLTRLMPILMLIRSAGASRRARAVAVAVAARALLSKRAGEVARAWPRLAASHGSDWPGVFMRWADGRPPRGPWRDGWDLARAVRDRLAPAAVLELAECEARWSYDGVAEPRRRPVGVRRIPRGVVVQAFGRLVTLGGGADGVV